MTSPWETYSVRNLNLIEGIVLHRAQPAPGSADWYAYHYAVPFDGTDPVLRVPLNRVAPHAKDWNHRTIGIYLEGDFAQAEPGKQWIPQPAQVKQLCGLVAQLYAQLGRVLWVAGHTELGPSGTAVASKLCTDPDHSCPGIRFDLATLRAQQKWPTRPTRPA